MRYLLNIIIINIRKILRIFKILIFNTLIIVFLSVIFIPYLQKFILYISNITIDNSIINTFLGAIIGINVTTLLSKKKEVKDFYKNCRLPIYLDYTNILNKAIYCLDGTGRFKLFYNNFNLVSEISNIIESQLPGILVDPLIADKKSINELIYLINEAKKTITNYIQHFFEFNEENITLQEDNILSLLDILISEYSDQDKKYLINIYFNKFKEENSCDGKESYDFIYWAFNYDCISNLNTICKKSLKQFKIHRSILEYNSRYIDKRIKSYNFSDV